MVCREQQYLWHNESHRRLEAINVAYTIASDSARNKNATSADGTSLRATDDAAYRASPDLLGTADHVEQIGICKYPPSEKLKRSAS